MDSNLYDNKEALVVIVDFTKNLRLDYQSFKNRICKLLTAIMAQFSVYFSEIDIIREGQWELSFIRNCLELGNGK